jgi:hypothetical protein
MGSNPVKATICPRGGTVDPLVLETSVARRVGSNPTEGTNAWMVELVVTLDLKFSALKWA